MVGSVAVAAGPSHFCSPSAPGFSLRRGSLFHRRCWFELSAAPLRLLAAHDHGWFCRSRCWSEHASARLRPLALLTAMVYSVAIAAGPSTLLLAFGPWFFASSRFALSPSLLVRALFCSPSAPGSVHRHGWFCCRRCWPEHASARLRPLVFRIAAVRSFTVAVGSSSLLLPLCPSPWLVLLPSLLVRARFCSPSAPGFSLRRGSLFHRRCLFELSSAPLRLLAVLMTIVGSIAVAARPSTLLLTFGP